MLVWGHDSKKTRPETTLPILRTTPATSHDGRSAGRSGGIRSPQVLRPRLHGIGHEQSRGDEECPSLAGPEASKVCMRRMWSDRTVACPSQRRELAQQRYKQFKNALLELSSKAALVARRTFPKKAMGAGEGIGWPSRLLCPHRSGFVIRGCEGDARAHLQSLGKATRLATALSRYRQRMRSALFALGLPQAAPQAQCSLFA